LQITILGEMMTTKKVLVDAHVEIDINMGWVTKRDIEVWAKRLESEARDVKEFIRDHKSMDVNNVYVVREYGYMCEHCKYVFDRDEESPECCEKAIREWASKEELINMGFDEEFVEQESNEDYES